MYLVLQGDQLMADIFSNFPIFGFQMRIQKIHLWGYQQYVAQR